MKKLQWWRSWFMISKGMKIVLVVKLMVIVLVVVEGVPKNIDFL